MIITIIIIIVIIIIILLLLLQLLSFLFFIFIIIFICIMFIFVIILIIIINVRPGFNFLPKCLRVGLNLVDLKGGPLGAKALKLLGFLFILTLRIWT